MAITAALVKELREKTGVGMMKCKQALVETDGDVEKAIANLRKAGAAVAAKKAGREANEGKVFFATSGTTIAAVEVFCETEPTSGNEGDIAFGESAAKLAAEGNITDLPTLLASPLNDSTVQEELNVLVGRITENIGIKRHAIISSENAAVATYSHMGGKIGVVVRLTFPGTATDMAVIETVAKDLAMQVAATAPIAVNSSEVSAEIIASEREVYVELARKAGTKEEYIDRQIEGKLKKYLKEVCLAEQMFIKDTKKPVTELLKETAAAAGVESLEIGEFVRFELGK